MDSYYCDDCEAAMANNRVRNGHFEGKTEGKTDEE